MTLSPTERADQSGAFVAHAQYGGLELSAARSGPLAGLTCAVKDLFDIAGIATGAGSPDWLTSHPVPEHDSVAVTRVLAAGATIVGKTVTDEMAWSLLGDNHHYGAPLNPRAPDRVTGGSSAGSASAVAAGLADIALGTDTGGSVRGPASFCGLWGMRPSHGRIPLDGVVPLAPSFDVVGWFAAKLEHFCATGPVLLDRPRPGAQITRLLIASDLFAAADSDVAVGLQPAVNRVADACGASVQEIALERLDEWRKAFTILQAAEIWATHGDWVKRVQPQFGPGVRERFAAASAITPEENAQAEAQRRDIRARLDDLLGGDAVLLAPTMPCPAPLRASTAQQRDAFRTRALNGLCPAGLAGLPQISMPLGEAVGAPVGLSLIGPRGADEKLIDLARRVA